MDRAGERGHIKVWKSKSMRCRKSGGEKRKDEPSMVCSNMRWTGCRLAEGVMTQGWISHGGGKPQEGHNGRSDEEEGRRVGEWGRHGQSLPQDNAWEEIFSVQAHGLISPNTQCVLVLFLERYTTKRLHHLPMCLPMLLVSSVVSFCSYAVPGSGCKWGVCL